MKNFVGALVVVLCAVSFVQSAAAATVVRTGEVVSVASDQRVEGNFYALGSTISLTGPVAGDVVAAAGTVAINAPIEHDVLALAGTVGINATVTEDVRILGGDVTIGGYVGGSVFVVGGRLTVLSTATIAGDVLIVAGDAVVEGVVKGQLLGVAERVRIDSSVAAVDIETPSLVLGDRADVGQDILYTSTADLVRAPGAKVGGTITKRDADSTANETPYRTVAIGFLISLFASLSLYLIAKRPLTLYARQATHNIAREGFIGFALLVTVPVAIIILMVSVLGIFVGLLGLALFVLMIILAIPLMNIIAGALLARTFQNTHEVTSLHIALGALVVQVMLFVPLIGPILLFVLFVATIGGIVTGLYRLLRLS